MFHLVNVQLIVGYKPCCAGTVWVSVCWEGRCTLSVVTTAGATSTLSRGDDDDNNDDDNDDDNDDNAGTTPPAAAGPTWRA